MTVTEKAYAKVNLSLDVLRKRSDGYHDLCMIAHTVDLCDDITIELTESGTVSCSCSVGFIPSDGRNLAVAAANLFFERTGLWNGGARISIEKCIPVCAGLGGGSADAAAVLRALNRLLSAGLAERDLCELAIPLGSDVPFCVGGGAQLMEGKGEVLTPLPLLPDCFLVICKPADSLSTERVFTYSDSRPIKHRPDTAGMIRALEVGNISDFGRRMFNVLEEPASRLVREIAPIRGRLIDLGALGACMTGSGSAVIGLFTDSEVAANAARSLSDVYAETYLTRPVGRIEL